MFELRERAIVQALGSLGENGEIDCNAKGVDIIGDIAVLKIPKSMESKKYKIGNAMLRQFPKVRCVFRQTSPANFGDKVMGVEWLAGENRTETIYREYGCEFKLDIGKVFFSPRLSWERHRIAGLVRHKEVIVNMFAGVGTFSIIIAKNAKVERTFSIDKNPRAYEYMLENIALNGVEDKVKPLLGDSKEFLSDLRGLADRILMPLPELACDYIPYALEYLKPNGSIHIYIHRDGKNKSAALAEGFRDILNLFDPLAKIKNISGKVVRSVGCRRYQLVFDLDLEKRVYPNGTT